MKSTIPKLIIIVATLYILLFMDDSLLANIVAFGAFLFAVASEAADQLFEKNYLPHFTPKRLKKIMRFCLPFAWFGAIGLTGLLPDVPLAIQMLSAVAVTGTTGYFRYRSKVKNLAFLFVIIKL